MNRQLRVLLVEDNPGDADLIRDVLSRDGSTTFEVAHTPRLETALGLVVTENFDLVLLDLSLPDSAGLETVRAVRRRAPDIPVVVLTGHDDERVGLAAVQEGAQDYLVKGQVTGALVSRVLRYAIERQQNSLRLRESDERLSFALEASRTGAWDFDLGDLTCRRSLQHDRMFGYESLLPEWTYATFLDHVVLEDRAVVDQSFQSAVVAQDDVSFECRILRADAQVRWVLVAGRHRVGGGGARHMAGIIRDVTEHKMAEQERLEVERRLQQSQRLESLGVLAGGIAHDFNNILTGILGNAELGLVELPVSAAARANLLEIAKASTRAAGLCREMLAYAGRGHFAIELMDLGALVEDLLGLLRTSISKKAVLNLDLGKGLPHVLGDPGQLSQVIMNLVINASDAIGERGGVIRISTGAMECSGDYLGETYATQSIAPGLYLALEVSDTGYGMDDDTRSRIFEPFFTTKFAGRGLGLAAVLGIVRGHKGALGVTSEPGRGSTFTVLLPATEAKKGASEGEGAAVTRNWRGQGTILLVDDEEAIRAIGASMLSHLGFSVICAADGHEALELYSVHRHEVVLVLLDLTMPNMDGEETFNALRRLDPGAPVVLSSGYTEHDVASRFAGKGLSGFIQKPYSLAQLQQRVRAALEGGE